MSRRIEVKYNWQDSQNLPKLLHFTLLHFFIILILLNIYLISIFFLLQIRSNVFWSYGKQKHLGSSIGSCILLVNTFNNWQWTRIFTSACWSTSPSQFQTLNCELVLTVVSFDDSVVDDARNVNSRARYTSTNGKSYCKK